MSKAKEALENLAGHLEVSPASAIQMNLDMLEEAYEGKIEIVDATNPYMNLIECSAIMAAGSLMRSEVLSRREFKTLAQTEEDLFPHMSDEDHKDRFSKPSKNTNVVFAYDAEEIRDSAVMDNTLGLPKVTIPRDTMIKVAGISFYLHYPIDLIVANDGQIVALWDTSIKSPIKELLTNTVNSTLTYIDRREVILLDLPLDQLETISESIPVSQASGFKTNFSFKDQFYYARVYYTTDNINWIEMSTTYDTQVYDIAKPTAVLQVTGQSLEVYVPEIYITNNAVGSNIRTDIYTTKGDITADLSGYDTKSWTLTYEDYSELSTDYSAPLSGLTAFLVISKDTVSGGSDGLTFEQLRDRVLYGLYDKDQPVTFLELKEFAKQKGLGIERQKDNITERTFVTTTKLDTVGKENLNTGAGIASTSVRVDSSRVDLNNHLIVNGNLTVIKPNSLFINKEGATVFMSDQEVISFDNLSVYDKADLMNETDYFYTPFHYVVDSSGLNPEARAYYLSEPTVSSVNFENLNSDLGFIVNTISSEMTYDSVSQEYTIVFTASTPGNGSSVTAVLNYTDTVTGLQWDMVAQPEIIDSSLTKYTFVIESSLALDVNNDADYLNMTGSTSVLPKLGLESTVFDMVYILNEAGTTSFDSVMAGNELNTVFTAITHERIDVQFGRHCKDLYCPVRPVITEPVYKLRTEDLAQVHLEDKLLTDSTGPIATIDENGDISFEKIHSQGDPILINGEPTYHYRAGDRWLDPLTGEPVIIKDSAVGYDLRMMLVDAGYQYADTASIKAYNAAIPSSVLTILDNDIGVIQDGLLEQTELYFEPVSDKVKSIVRLDSNKEAYIDTSLRFSVSVRLTGTAINEPVIRDRITTAIKEGILAVLDNRAFYMSDLYAQLRDVSPSNISNIEIESPIPGANMAILQEDNASFTLASKVLVLANGQLDVVDDIEILFTS